MGRITVIGSLNMDLVATLKYMPKIGETVTGYDFKQFPGGKGANQAVAMARLGGKVNMIGKVGVDSFGDILIDSLKKNGVNVENIKKEKNCSTGVALIIVDEQANNSIVVISGANYKITKKDIDEILDVIKDSKIVVIQLEVPLEVVRHSLIKSKELGKYTILNPAPAEELDDEIMKNIDLLIPNETEVEILGGIEIKSEKDIVSASKKLIKRGVKKIIVTLGEKGSIYITEKEVRKFDAYKANAVDTTAAGDAYIGAIAVALVNDEDIDIAIDMASKVGALTVIKEGAQSSLPYLDDVINFKKENL